MTTIVATRTITGRVVLVTCATAVVAVIVTALVALPLVLRSANNQARAELGEKAALAVELLATERPAQRERIVRQLRADGIAVYLLRRGLPDRPGLPARVIAQVAAGAVVSARGLVDARSVLIAGRPLSGRDAGVVLTRPAVTLAGAQVLHGVQLALVAGLLGAIAAGAALAQVIARPIRQAAAAAGRLSAGDRSVRLAVRAPAEVAELAEAFNALAAALRVSEGREREFLLSVSHELRTPLSTIRGYAEALADGVIDAEPPPLPEPPSPPGSSSAPEPLSAPDGPALISGSPPSGGSVFIGGVAGAGATMLAEAERLDRLICDLLVLARLESVDLPLEVVAVDLVELVAAAAQAWTPRCRPDGPTLRTELPTGPVHVHTDPGRIRQVVDGLCENALRIVPAGAPLVLAVRAQPGGGIVEVRDGGPGFTDADLAVAFERGALHQRYRGIRKVGSGLGLALAARLVSRLGGTIEAGHAAEGGARFTVSIPAGFAPPAPTARPPTPFTA